MEPFSNDPDWVRAESSLRLLGWLVSFNRFTGGAAVVLSGLFALLSPQLGAWVLAFVASAMAGGLVLASSFRRTREALSTDAARTNQALLRAVVGGGIWLLPAMFAVAWYLVAHSTGARYGAQLVGLATTAAVPGILVVILNGLFLTLFGRTFRELGSLQDRAHDEREREPD